MGDTLDIQISHPLVLSPADQSRITSCVAVEMSNEESAANRRVQASGIARPPRHVDEGQRSLQPTRDLLVDADGEVPHGPETESIPQ